MSIQAQTTFVCLARRPALDGALAGNRAKRAELTVLGGTAAIIEGLLTRDRGSKLLDAARPNRTTGKVPFRSTTIRILERLASSEGGLRVLHSLAVTHTEGSRALPRLFHARTGEFGGIAVIDGDPVLDNAGSQMELELEWDLFAAADPVTTAAMLSRPRSGENNEDGDDLVARHRDKLGSNVAAALRPATQLQ